MSLKKFILVTRGRTGSTAIIDSLNKADSVTAGQELFMSFPDATPEMKVGGYETFTPFDVWTLSDQERPDGVLEEADLALSAERYFSWAEKAAEAQNFSMFGFKALHHHFSNHPYLPDILAERNYKSLYLVRNIPRQAISGLVSQQRGTYNSKKAVVDNAKYEIDIERLLWQVNFINKGAAEDYKKLKEKGLDPIVVHYENFLNDPSRFFAELFNHCGVTSATVPKSDYKVMISDLSETISNYDDVVEALKSVGTSLEGTTSVDLNS